MTNVRAVAAASLVLFIGGACHPDDSNVVRGKGMTVAPLSANQRAQAYAAAARGSFDLTDPALSLLLDRRLLPRTVGLAPDGRISDDTRDELRRMGAIKGTCEPPLSGTVGTAHCKAELPGYVVRFSPVFAMRGDTMQVYMYAQKYDTPSSGVSETLRFERAYQLVRNGSGWRAVREGRVPKEIRGESK